MSFDLSNPRLFRVFLSSPEDVKEERRIVHEVTEAISKEGREEGYRVEVFDWSQHVTRRIGPAPQDLIDSQLSEYDIYVGIMGHRFGTPTGPYDSGTEKEFRDALEKWQATDRPWILFYFNQCLIDPYSEQFSLDEFSKVRRFRNLLKDERLGIAADYDALRGQKDCFEAKVGEDIRGIIRKLKQSHSAPPGIKPRSKLANWETDKLALTIHVDREGSIRLDGRRNLAGKIALDQIDKDVVRLFHNLLLNYHITDIEELKVMGKLLFRSMFSGETLETFRSRLDYVESLEKPLKLNLRLEENQDLAVLPWEYMFYEGPYGQHFFLATRTKLRLTRRYPQSGPVAVFPSKQLKILIVAADPRDQQGSPENSSAIADELKAAVTDRLRDPELKDRCEIEIIVSPSLDEFERLLGSGFNVVHIIGRRVVQHGGYRIAWRGHEGGIHGESLDFGPNRPKLVLLQLRCDAGSEPPEPAMLPAQLIGAGIPMVVTLPPAFTKDLAVKFATEFYDVLAKFGTSDDAITEARKLTIQAASKAGKGFGMPVLYLSGDDTTVLKSEPLSVTPKETSASPGARGTTTSENQPPLTPTLRRAMDSMNVATGGISAERSGAQSLVQTTRRQAPFDSERVRDETGALSSIPPKVIAEMKLSGLKAAKTLDNYDSVTAREAMRRLDYRVSQDEMRSLLGDLIRESDVELAIVYHAMLEKLPGEAGRQAEE